MESPIHLFYIKMHKSIIISSANPPWYLNALKNPKNHQIYLVIPIYPYNYYIKATLYFFKTVL